MIQRESTQLAAVNGTRLFYERVGAGAPIVLVSGGGTLDARQWDDQFERLAQSYDVVRYDVRGIGRSARPTGEFSHHEDLRALLEFLKIPRAVICGVSFGAVIAIDFALDYPRMTAGLVLAGSSVSSEKAASVEAVRALSALAAAEGLETAISLVTGMPSFVSPSNASARARIRQIYLDHRDLFADGFPLVSLWRPTQPPAGERLHEIDAPTLVIVGANDDPAILDHAERLSAAIPHARKLVIAGAGHMVNMDAPAELTRVVLEFLALSIPGYRPSTDVP